MRNGQATLVALGVAVFCGGGYLMIRPDAGNDVPAVEPGMPSVEVTEPDVSDGVEDPKQLPLTSAPEVLRVPHDPVGDAANSPDSSPGTKSPDADEADPWDGLPRLAWSFARHVTARPDLVVATDLYRHRELNPLDKRFGKVAAAELDALVSHYHQQIVALKAQRRSVRTTEVKDALKAGFDEDEEQVEDPDAGVPAGVIKEGRVGSFRRAGVRVLTGQTLRFIPMRKLPQTKATWDYQGFIALEMAGAITNWFQSMGLLDSKGARLLLEQASTMVEHQTKRLNAR